MRTYAIILAAVVLSSGLSGCTPDKPPAVSTPRTDIHIHYMDRGGNCSVYLVAEDDKQLKKMLDWWKSRCNLTLATCKEWIAIRDEAPPPERPPGPSTIAGRAPRFAYGVNLYDQSARPSTIAERALHTYLKGNAKTTDNWWLDVPEIEDLALWMDSYCGANPRNYTVDGAHKFVEEQKEQARKDDQKEQTKNQDHR